VHAGGEQVLANKAVLSKVRPRSCGQPLRARAAGSVPE